MAWQAGRERSGGRLRIGRDRPVPAAANALAEFFALLRRHLFPAFPHATRAVTAAATRSVESAEENLAEDDQAHCLPVADRFPAEDRRHQPVPQVLDHE